MNAVDTNVFVYSLDADESVKQPKAQALLQRLAPAVGSTVLLWQVAAELLSNLRKLATAGRMTADEVEAHFRDFLALFPLNEVEDFLLAIS